MTCKICGAPLRPDNKIGMCSRTPRCRTSRVEHYRKLRAAELRELRALAAEAAAA